MELDDPDTMSDNDFATRVMDTLALLSQKLTQLQLQVEGGTFPNKGGPIPLDENIFSPPKSDKRRRKRTRHAPETNLLRVRSRRYP
jgi:hypothetical protein